MAKYKKRELCSLRKNISNTLKIDFENSKNNFRSIFFHQDFDLIPNPGADVFFHVGMLERNMFLPQPDYKDDTVPVYSGIFTGTKQSSRW